MGALVRKKGGLKKQYADEIEEINSTISEI